MWTRAQILNSGVHAAYWARIIFCWPFQRVEFSSYLIILQISVHLWKSICRIKEDRSVRNKWKLFPSLRIEKRAPGYYWFDVGQNYDFVLLLLFIPIIIIYHVCLIFFFCNIAHVFSPLYSHWSPPWLGCYPHRLRPESHNSFRTDSLPPLPDLEHHHQVGHPHSQNHQCFPTASGWIPQFWNLDFTLHHNCNSLLLPP